MGENQNFSYVFRFNEFKNKMNKKVFNFFETKPGVFEKNYSFYVKNKSVLLVEYTAVNTFCWNVRDEINILFEKDLTGKQNMSNKEKKALNQFIKTGMWKFALMTRIKILGQLAQIKTTS